ECALIALCDGKREVFGPAPPEIDVDPSAALANGQHLALDDRKPAMLGRDPRRIFRPFDSIIRFGPQAKLAIARHAFAQQEGGRAGLVADPGSDASVTAPDKIGLYPAFRTVASGEHLNGHPAITVGVGSEAAQHHDLANEGFERRLGFLRKSGRDRRHFDSRQTYVATIFERK